MPQPTLRDVHVNAPLTSISIAFLSSLDDYIATKAFPIVSVAKDADVYFTFPRQQWFRTDAKKRAPGTESAGSGFAVSTDSYRAEVRALHKDVDDQLRANQDSPLDLDAAAAEFVTRQLLLRREKDFVSNFFTTGIWTGSTTGGDITPGTKWSNLTAGTPIADIRAQMTAMKRKTGFMPNKLVLPQDVWDKVQDSDDFLNRVAIVRDKIVTKDLLASVLGLDEVLIAGATEDTAAEGAASTFAYVMTDDALLLYTPPRPSLMHPSAGYHFSWSGFLGAGQDGLRMKRFRMEPLASDRVEGEMAYDQKVVAADLGVFFDDVL